MSISTAEIIQTDEVDVNFINSLNYPDFVGFINQWNVLPGAHTTISKWINYANITSASRLMQVACTTGFQSREIASRTGCSAKAFDLSPYAIKSAIWNKERFAPGADVGYFCADGLKYKTEERFSHVAIGAGLKFFSDPSAAFAKCLEFLTDGGCLLASPFYTLSPVPTELLQQAKSVFGITPTTESYKEIMKSYSSLEFLYEDRNTITPETEEELAHYCESTVGRACKVHGIKNEEVYTAMYSRLHRVKEMSNMLRPYQGYSVLVLRYSSLVYPNRFVELF